MRSFHNLTYKGNLSYCVTRDPDLAYNTVLLIHLSILQGSQAGLMANVCSGDIACVKLKGVQSRPRTSAQSIWPFFQTKP